MSLDFCKKFCKKLSFHISICFFSSFAYNFRCAVVMVSFEIWKHDKIFSILWWVCGCRSKSVPGTANSLTSSGIIFRVSSFVFNACSVLFLSDTFSKEAVIPMRSPCSEFVMTLVAYCPEDASIDLTANSILGVLILSITIKFFFWILSLTVSAILPICLSILSLKHLSKFCTLTKFSFVVKLMLVLLTENSWSAVPSLNTTFFACRLQRCQLKCLGRSHQTGWEAFYLNVFSCKWKPCFFSQMKYDWNKNIKSNEKQTFKMKIQLNRVTI